MKDADDGGLVQRVLDGNTNAYRILIDRHKGRVFYCGLKFCRNKPEAEDFAQEVFLRAFRKLDTYRGKGSFSAWIYRIAFNLGVNRFRDSKVALEAAREVDREIDSFDTGEDTPEELVIKDELKIKIKGAVNNLPDLYALVLKMHFFDGLTYAEIGGILNRPVNTVKSQVSRAKVMIKKQLEGYMGDDDDE